MLHVSPLTKLIYLLEEVNLFLQDFWLSIGHANNPNLKDMEITKYFFI